MRPKAAVGVREPRRRSPDATLAEKQATRTLSRIWEPQNNHQTQTERWKLTWYAGEDYGELYDLEEDPNEFVNLWDRCHGVRKELTERLLDEVLVNQDALPPKESHA